MKICWDNLENIKYTTNEFFRDFKNSYKEKL